jgi:hypothetical protein
MICDYAIEAMSGIKERPPRVDDSVSQGRGAWHRLVDQSLDRRSTWRSPVGGSKRTRCGAMFLFSLPVNESSL